MEEEKEDDEQGEEEEEQKEEEEKVATRPHLRTCTTWIVAHYVRTSRTWPRPCLSCSCTQSLPTRFPRLYPRLSRQITCKNSGRFRPALQPKSGRQTTTKTTPTVVVVKKAQVKT